MRFLVTLLFVALVLVSFHSSVAKAALISHWRFDGDLTDSAASGNDLSIVTGTEAYSGTVGGSYSTQSLSLNGSTSFVDTSPANTAFASGEYSLAGWFVMDADGSGHRGIFARGALGGNEADFYLYLQNSTDFLSVAHNRNNGGTNEFAQFPIPPDDTLFHLAVTYDGTTARAYYNGVEQAAVNGTALPYADFVAPLITEPDELNVGDVDTNFTSVPTTGLIDELFLFDEVLTLQQINNLIAFNATELPPVVPEPSTCLLLGLGVLGLVRRTRRLGRRNRRS